MSFGWAIISAGDYANSRGAPGINQAADADLVAVQSRNQGRADAFAEQHGLGLLGVDDHADDDAASGGHVGQRGAGRAAFGGEGGCGGGADQAREGGEEGEIHRGGQEGSCG